MHLPWCLVPIAPHHISVTPPAPVPALLRQLGLLYGVVQLPTFVYEHFTHLSPHTSNTSGSHVSPMLGAAGRGQLGAPVAHVGRQWLVGHLFIASQLTMPCPDGAWSATHCITCLAAVPIPFSVFIHPLTLCAQPLAVCKETSRSPAWRLICHVQYRETRRWEAFGEEQQRQLGHLRDPFGERLKIWVWFNQALCLAQSVCKSSKGFMCLKGEEWGGAGIMRDEPRGRMRRNGIKSIRGDIWGEIWQNVAKVLH